MEETHDPKKRQELYDELCGNMRAATQEEDDVPSWWRGDDDAFQNTMAAIGNLPTRRR